MPRLRVRDADCDETSCSLPLESPLASDKLWTQPEAAEYLGVSPAYLRESSCPKVLLPPVRGKKPLVRYVPDDVRSWIRNWRVA